MNVRIVAVIALLGFAYSIVNSVWLAGVSRRVGHIAVNNAAALCDFRHELERRVPIQQRRVDRGKRFLAQHGHINGVPNALLIQGVKDDAATLANLHKAIASLSLDCPAPTNPLGGP